MPAAKKDFLIEQRATWRKRLIYRDSKRRPINLTGWSARMDVRTAKDATSTLILSALSSEIDPVKGQIIITPLTGSIEVVLPVDVTRPLTVDPKTKLFYDLKLYSPNGDEIRLLEGQITVSWGTTE